MTGARITAFCFLPLLLAAAPSAEAHRLNLFAAWNGTVMAGEAYFTGGSGARDIEVRALGPDGKVVARARTDATGAFVLPAIPAAYLDLIADAGDGHVAHFSIRASDMSGTVEPNAPASVVPGPAVSGAPAPDGFEAIVERAVARRVAPLQRQIAEYEAQVRLHDILGGIGYLVGVAGLGFWWLARREAKGRGQ